MDGLAVGRGTARRSESTGADGMIKLIKRIKTNKWRHKKSNEMNAMACARVLSE